MLSNSAGPAGDRRANESATPILLPSDLILLTPFDRDPSQGLLAKREPGRFDPAPPHGVLEPPERPCAANRLEEVLANGAGLHGGRKVLHDFPLVNIELRREVEEAASG